MALLTRTHTASRMAAAALAAALAWPALAQNSVSTPFGNSTASTAAPEARTPGAKKERHEARHAQRLADLKAKLQLTAEQESAWAAFAAAHQPMQRTPGMDRQALQALTTPERIDRMRALRTERMAAMDKRDEATKVFYASLSAQQQQTFDTLSLRHHGKHHGAMGQRGDNAGHGGHHGQRHSS